ncbi:hypothetical protein SRHO_G00300640 [Serrasalmus rhombeus]
MYLHCTCSSGSVHLHQEPFRSLSRGEKAQTNECRHANCARDVCLLNIVVMQKRPVANLAASTAIRGPAFGARILRGGLRVLLLPARSRCCKTNPSAGAPRASSLHNFLHGEARRS